MTTASSEFGFWAAGNALISGSDTALLYDSAVAAGREAESSTIANRSFQVLLAAQAIGSIVGGLLGVVDLRLPILATVALTLAAVVLLGQIVEPPRHHAQELTWTQTLRTATTYVRSRPRLATSLTYSAVLSGTAFFVPFQPQMQAQGVPVGWLGVFFAGLRLAALAGARYGPRVVTETSLRAWPWGIPALMALGLFAVAASPVWWPTLLAMLFVAAVNALIRPETTALLNRQVSGSVRATVMSAQNLTMTIYIALLHPAIGAVADAWSTAGAFALLAFLCAVPALLSISLRAIAAPSNSAVAPRAVIRS